MPVLNGNLSERKKKKFLKALFWIMFNLEGFNLKLLNISKNIKYF